MMMHKRRSSFPCHVIVFDLSAPASSSYNLHLLFLMAKGYAYNPSEAAAGIFCALFAITAIVHIVQMFPKKAWVMAILILATLMEITGYITRIIASTRTSDTRTPRIISETTLVVAPAFLTAQNYMVVGRLISYVGGDLAVIPDKWITKIFVTADLICIVTQGLGAAVLSSSDSQSKIQTARVILLAGLIIQIVTFGVFLITTILFDMKAKRVKGGDVIRPLRRLFIAIYLAGTLITIRSIFRAAEFGSLKFNGVQQTGYLITHEWPFFIFDSVPIFIATAIFNIIYPSNYIPLQKGVSMDSNHELMGKEVTA
ncbi:hypothetical protein FRC03_010535 [Tulasnella sp. 419]|nr:hypothetical protein FRC02_005026 [Tulasnella sp. 418]KAG8967162.1 hypothetical protein FRC03_010535 [Tulasnella sp. 419]